MFRSTGVFCLLILLCMLPQNSWAAKKLRKLDEGSIKEFISTTNRVTSGRANFRNPKQVESYLERHINENARFVSTMKYIIPGFPPQENAMSLGKEDFMDSVSKGAEDVGNYENQIEVLSIDLSRDQTKATVKTRSVEKGKMAVGEEGQQVDIIGQSDCTQLIGLSDRGYIQMNHAACTTEIQFQEF